MPSKASCTGQNEAQLAGWAVGACAWLLELSGQGTGRYHVKHSRHQDVFGPGVLCICLTRNKHTADRD